MPKLSILVPTFNRVDYLRECLDSLLATRVDCEIVVSDNASTDGTEAMMRGYTDPRIRYHRHESNIGSTENHNFLLAQARGSYMCLFGDDDRALPGCFERKTSLLDAYPQIDMIYSLSQIIGPKGEPIPLTRVMGRTDFSYLGGRDEFSALLLNCYISWQTLVFRREVYEEVGPLHEWGLKASIDWYWLQQCVQGREVGFLATPTVEIRQHPGSFSESTVRKEGYWRTDRMIIWRRWLLEADVPVMVTDLMWERMVQIVAIDVREQFGNDQGRINAALEELGNMCAAYNRRMDSRFQARVAIADHFHPDVPAWPLESRKQTAFLCLPWWASATWEAILTSYCRAFEPDDPTTLVIWLDPAQGLSQEQAFERILKALADAGLDPDAIPDVLLVPDAFAPADLARLFSAVDWVVPGKDPIHVERAERMGKPCLTALTPEAWRAALADRDDCRV